LNSYARVSLGKEYLTRNDRKLRESDEDVQSQRRREMASVLPYSIQEQSHNKVTLFILTYSLDIQCHPHCTSYGV